MQSKNKLINFLKKFWKMSEHLQQGTCMPSHVWLFATRWTIAHQASLSMGIFQARILEQAAMPFSRVSSQPRDWMQISQVVGGFFYHLSHQGSPILGVMAPIRRQNTDLMFTFKRSVNVIVIPKEDDLCILCSDIPFQRTNTIWLKIVNHDLNYHDSR